MRILSALFDTALLPLSIAADIILPPVVRGIDGADHDSFTRERIEKIEENLR